jgi:hypothetical protein
MCRHCRLVRVFVRGGILWGLFVVMLLPAAMALAGEKEPLAILQLGAGTEWGLNGGDPGFGPTAAVEFNPIKNWLAIETGVTTLFGKGRTEWDTELIFKKPFDLSPSVEFEPGIGPAWILTIGSGRATNAIGAAVVAEFMFWPTPDRKLGWFLEPSFTYSFGNGHEKSLGVSAGLLVPIK